MVDVTPFQQHYPFTPHWFDLDGVRYHYLDEGDPAAPAVVLLHGNPTWSFYYRNLIPALSQTHRVIAPDHIGCGLSDKPQIYPYTLAQHVANIERLLAALNLNRMTLILHDWGGAIGMGYATRHPDRIARLVVCNTAAFFVPRLPWRIRICRVPLLGEWLVRGLNGFARAALLFATAHPRRLSREVRAGYLAPYNNWQNRIAIYRFVQDIPLDAEHPTRATLDEIDAGLARLREHPMLIVWGAQDFCFTARHFLPEWQRRFPRADVHVFPHAGHYVIEDAHGQILPIILKFLARQDEQD